MEVAVEDSKTTVWLCLLVGVTRELNAPGVSKMTRHQCEVKINLTLA